MNLVPQADSEDALPFTLQYTVGEGGEEQIAEATVIGTMAKGMPYDQTGKVYLVDLPYGAQVTGYANDSAMRTTYGSAKAAVSGSLEQIAGQYVDGELMIDPPESSYKTFLGYADITPSEKLKSEDVEGFIIYSTSFGQQPGAMVIVQISTKAPEEPLPFTLRYTVGEGGEEQTAEATVIGTMAKGMPYDQTGKVYLVDLPYGAQVTGYANDSAMRTTYGSAKAAVSGSLEQIAGQYVDGELMIDPPESSYKTFLGYADITPSEKLKSEDVEGFIIYSTSFGQQPGAMVIVQISTKAPEKPILTVADTEGNTYAVKKMRTPPTHIIGGDTYTVDYVDGMYTVTVPKGTESLRVALGDLSNVPEGEPAEKYAFFAVWGGGGSGGNWDYIWHLDPKFINGEYIYGNPSYEGLEEDGWAEYLRPLPYSDGYYTLPMDDFALDPSHISADQSDVYGTLDTDCEYAEIYVGTFRAGGYLDFDTLLLVKIGGNQSGQENTTPMRKPGISASETVQMDDLQYTLDLSTVFEDLDGDPMTYKVKESTEENYTQLEGNVFTYTFDGRDVTYHFTANDGYGDGAIYRITLTGTLQGLIRAGEAVVSDPSAHWREYDFYLTPSQYLYSDYSPFSDISSGYYQRMLSALETAKAAYDQYGEPTGGGMSTASNAKKNLKQALSCLMTRDRVNVSRLWLAVRTAQNRLASIDEFTAVTTEGLADALDQALTVYHDELYLSAYDAQLQARIDAQADQLLTQLDKLVRVNAYKDAYEIYRSRKDEARDLLGLCDPAKFNEADYTPDSWKAFIDAYQTLKADLEYKIQGEGGTTADWLMVRDFAKHIDALQDARNNLVSDRDITVSFSYINNFAALYPAIRKVGTDVYSNDALELSRGATTLYAAMQQAGLVFDKTDIYRSTEGGVTVQDGSLPQLMVYVNGVSYGTISLADLENNRRVIQLHDGDKVRLVRIPTPVVKAEASSGYDTTTIYYGTTTDVSLYKDSIAVISIDSLPQSVKVGDKAVFTASVTGSYATNLNQTLSPKGLSLYVSGPVGSEALNQNLVQTTAVTDGQGTLSYIFTEPGWYTVAMLNAQQEDYTFTNVFSETTYGSYGSVYAGDFALVYVAPAEDEQALIAAQRAENLNQAEAYFGQYHAYDFGDDDYAEFTQLYEKLVDNQNSAGSFKALVDSFNADYAALEDYARRYALDHETLIQAIRDNLQYIPRDLSQLDYTYANLITRLQGQYAKLNDYQKTLLSRNENTLLEAIMDISASDLAKPASVSVQVMKDSNVTLPQTYGNLSTAPNENCVYILYPDGTQGRTYYQWKTGNSQDMEPSCAGMSAYPGNQIGVRRIITQTEEAYWLVYSIDGGTTWKLMNLVDGGANSPMVMLQALFVLPDTGTDLVTLQYKAVSQTEYEQIKLNEGTPEMALDEAKASYQAALLAVFASYDPDRYEEDDYIDIRDAKNNGLDNIAAAKDVAFAARALEVAIAAMEAVPAKDEVHVVIRNDVLPVADGAAWEGVLVDRWVPIGEDSSMMSAIQQALADAGYTGEGLDTGYISDINGLGEFGGGSGSGWMGTLNDWFTNEGFSQFTVANGKLKGGDEICLEYTCKLGADIRGGVQGNTDTSLYTLSLTGGALTPAFDKGTVDYLFMLDDDTHATQLQFSANNRSFQVRGYRNDYTPSAAQWIRSGQTIPVQNGDILYVGVGETSWAAMGKGEPTVYTIAVVDDNGAAEALIRALPAPDMLTYADRGDVDRAYLVFQSLDQDQQAALGSDLADKLAACVARIELLKSVEQVRAGIDALPAPEALTLADRFSVESVKALYEALGSDGQDELPIISIAKLEACAARIAELLDSLDITEIYQETGGYLAGLGTPGVGSEGGEWIVVGLTRGGQTVSSGWADGYYANAVAYIQENMNAAGQLHTTKSTDNSRMILALTALGKDVTNVGGKNLLSALANLEYVQKQGINGPIWALIALDTHGYEIPILTGGGTQTTRENLIGSILNAQLADGGWALSGINADPDMTGMALQALAPYANSNPQVRDAVDRALTRLSTMQNDAGGYGSWGTTNSESCAQVIVALTALDINPDTDSRFIKNGTSVMDALCAYYVEGGGFRHTQSGDRNGMATEQGFYALVAYQRFLNGESRLYDMTDVQIADPVQDAEALIAAIGTVTADSGSAIRAARAVYDALTKEQRSRVKNRDVLIAAETAYEQILERIDAVVALIDSIGELRADAASKSRIEAAQEAYDALSDAEKRYVTNFSQLTQAHALYSRLVNAQRVIDLIDSIGEVRQDSAEAIRTARAAYNALTAQEQALVTNYSKLTAAERKLASIDPEGKTKVIGDGDTKVVIDGVTYMVDAEAATLMLAIADLAEEETPDLQGVIDAYQTYMAMSDELKAQVFNYDDLEAMTVKLGQEHHEDTATGMRVSDLDWYIQLVVEPLSSGSEYEVLSGSIGSNTLIAMWRVRLVDLLTGEDYEPETGIEIQVSAPAAAAAFEQLRIACYSHDGRLDYSSCTLKDGMITWQIDHLASYALIGSNDEQELAALSEPQQPAVAEQKADREGPAEEPASLTWLWVLIGCLAVGGIAALISVALIKRKRA